MTDRLRPELERMADEAWHEPPEWLGKTLPPKAEDGQVRPPYPLDTTPLRVSAPDGSSTGDYQLLAKSARVRHVREDAAYWLATELIFEAHACRELEFYLDLMRLCRGDEEALIVDVLSGARNDGEPAS